MRKLPTVPAVLSVAAVLLLSACGGDSSDTAATSSSSSASATSSAAPESSAGAGDSEAFCADAQAAIGSINTAFETATTDPTQLSAALQSSADELGAVTAPDEIAADWQTLADVAQQLADATAGVDITTPEGQATVQDVFTQIEGPSDAASANVEAYVTDTCGAAPGATPTS